MLHPRLPRRCYYALSLFELLLCIFLLSNYVPQRHENTRRNDHHNIIIRLRRRPEYVPRMIPEARHILRDVQQRAVGRTATTDPAIQIRPILSACPKTLSAARCGVNVVRSRQVFHGRGPVLLPTIALPLLLTCHPLILVVPWPVAPALDRLVHVGS
jgi:hypothetical protein